MDFFFEPRGVAVIGATPNPLKGGNAILKNLQLGYRGPIYPVNPRYTEIEGLPCYPSMSAVPAQADLAIIFVPAPQVPAAVEACARKGVPGVMIESGGFAETGPEGAKLQQELTRIAARTGIRIWGPNCMGLVDDLAESTRTALQELFPSWMPVSNPIDLWPAMERHIGAGVDVYNRALAIVLGDPGVDAVFLHVAIGNARARLNLSALSPMIQGSGKPVIVWQASIWSGALTAGFIR